MLEGMSGVLQADWLNARTKETFNVSKIVRESDSLFPLDSFDTIKYSKANKLSTASGLTIAETQALVSQLGRENEVYLTALKKLAHSPLFLIIDSRTKLYVMVWIPETANQHFDNLALYFKDQTEDPEVPVHLMPMSQLFSMNSSFPAVTKTTTGMLWKRYLH